MGSKYIVVFSNEDDTHAVVLQKRISQIDGFRALVLDTADFPTDWKLVERIEDGRIAFSVIAGGTEIPDTDISGVWWRRPRSHHLPGSVRPQRVREFCSRESRSCLLAFLARLGNRVINAPSRELMASKKPYQLAVAHEVGLRVPATLVSNDPDSVRRFSERHHRVIFKILTDAPWQFTETRLLQNSHLSALEKLTLAPTIFQEAIELGLDLRVTYVDGEMFCSALTPTHPGAKYDWRLDQGVEARAFQLAVPIQDGLKKLMHKLGLRLGTIDLRANDAGETYFLEVNPSGQFLYCEIETGNQISAALAKALTRGQLLDTPASEPHG